MSDRLSDKPPVLSRIKPRNLGSWIKPRCPYCKSEPTITTGTYRPGAMFHPARPYGPCQVRTDGVVGGCLLTQARDDR
jgi:hypothetical protein